MENIVEEILRLKKERNAIILAHNYVRGEVQDIADFVGDSLELSRKAAQCDADVLVFCGVRFMGETAKLLSPKAVVLLPEATADCPMARMATAEAVKNKRAEKHNAVFIAYVNSTAEVKAEVDLCCTSGNAEKVVASIPENREIVFLPDRNLGANLENKLNRKMTLWNGFCPIHDAVTTEMIENARKKHPDAEVLVHLECRPEVVALADAALSTAGMLAYVAKSRANEFIIGTECGILHRLEKEFPDKKFVTLEPELICRDMKTITLEKVLLALRDGVTSVEMSNEHLSRGVKPIEKMLSIK